MALVRNFIRRLFLKRTHAEHNDHTKELNKYEFLCFKIRQIVMWENSMETGFTIVAVNFLFWFLAIIDWRFYRVLFSMIMIMTLHEMWTKQIWPEIRVNDPSRQISAENDLKIRESLDQARRLCQWLRKGFAEYYGWLKSIRDEKPGLFCLGFSVLLLLLSYIGRLVPGLLLIYVLTMSVLLVPGLWIHVISDNTKKLIRNRCTFVHQLISNSSYGVDGAYVDDLLPDITSEDIALLSQIAEPENFQDEVDSQGSSGTPVSYLAGIGDQLLPHNDHSADSLTTLSDLGTTRQMPDLDDLSDDSSYTHGIDFQTSHFNGDDSSDTDSEFTKGLKFSEADSATRVQSALPESSFVTNQSSLTSLLPGNLVGLGMLGQLASVLNRGLLAGPPAANQKPKDNSSTDSLTSEEDFEMISHEDIS